MIKATYESPSNIALVKYWGKYGQQLPRNPSISFTLSAAFTRTTVVAKKSDLGGFRFLFEGKENVAFADRIKKYIDTISGEIPSIATSDLLIESNNTFPHSSGIASSASAMSALALCLTDLETQISGKTFTDEEISSLARLGSGSASRSIYPSAAVWGEVDTLPNSSPLFAVGVEEYLAPEFLDYRDTILLVSHDKKSVSSTAGHQLMETNPYAETRYHEAGSVLHKMMDSLKEGDMESFVKWTEWEALNLHALMMVSHPSYLLMKPETLAIIERIRQFRQDTGIPICFTLDAGPNVHLLYPQDYEAETKEFIERSLMEFCDQKKVLYDKVGNGPRKIDVA